MGSPSISSVLLLANAFTVGNDLTGAKVVRIRTMARFLDAANFSGATNPLGTPDPTAEFPQEIYYIDRKKAENREVVSSLIQFASNLCYGTGKFRRLLITSEAPTDFIQTLSSILTSV